MALLQKIQVNEAAEELSRLYKQARPAVKPRLKMLQWIQKGICSTKELAGKTKASADSIAGWKKRYAQDGLTALTEERRGTYQRGALGAEQRARIEQRLSAPKEGFTSYLAAMNWINETFGLHMQYHAVNKYLKRNFHTKLKVGRKTHVQKDPGAETAFKKAWPTP